MSACSSPLFTPPTSPGPAQDSVAFRKAPDIAGLYYFPTFLSSIQCHEIIQDVIDEDYFDTESGRDQAVFFGDRDGHVKSGLPNWCDRFLPLVQKSLQNEHSIPNHVMALLFPPSDSSSRQANSQHIRQLILNCYEPGQGIAAHIDLPHKFADGIMIFSFGSAITMDFERVEPDDGSEHAIYLIPGSLCILSGESRWNWKHGIGARVEDLVWSEDGSERQRLPRGKRLSITVRWYDIDSQEITRSDSIEEDMKIARRTEKDDSYDGNEDSG